MSKGIYENINGVPLIDGRVMHMNIKRGDIANRIVTVGAVERAEKIAANFETRLSKVESKRGFTTITGIYKGEKVSIVAIGMGPSMMDFFVREARNVIDGPAVIVRFGTCGGLTPECPVGTIVVASKGSGLINRNPDGFPSSDATANIPRYNFFNVVPSSSEVSSHVYSKVCNAVGKEHVVEGVDVSAESFYSCQGRTDSNFDDDNEHNLDLIRSRYPEAKCLEMETFYLFHLAQCSRVPIYASAACIVLANRVAAQSLDEAGLRNKEEEGGRAVLEAVATFTFPTAN